MNGEPKSQRAANIAAGHCSYPGLDGTDSALLMYLATYADHPTGKNSHPGNLNIAHVLKLTDRPTDNRIRAAIERGLIERTSRADGRGKASTYRICWESSYFPDRAPGGEWLIEEPRCVDSADSHGTALRSDGNRAADEPKPRCADTETALSGQPATSIPTKSTNQPPTTGRGLEGWILKNHKRMGVPDKNIRNILDGKVRAKGEANVLKALDRFLDRPKGLDGLNNPWGVCLTEIDTYLAGVDDDNAAAIQKAKEEAAIQRNIERQIREGAERMKARGGPPVAEDPGDDLFR